MQDFIHGLTAPLFGTHSFSHYRERSAEFYELWRSAQSYDHKGTRALRSLEAELRSRVLKTNTCRGLAVGAVLATAALVYNPELATSIMLGSQVFSGLVKTVESIAAPNGNSSAASRTY